MRILHIVGAATLPRDPDAESGSGVARAALEIARAQANRGHKVTVSAICDHAWTTTWRGVHLVGLPPARFARIHCGDREIDLRLHLPYVLYSRLHQFDVIHGHLYPYLRFLRSPRRVAHFHSDPFFVGSSNEGIDMKPADFISVERFTHAQVAVSQFVAGEVKRGLGRDDEVSVVYNGVDRDHYDPSRRRQEGARVRAEWGLTPEDVVFLFIGAVAPEKGLLPLAQAFSSVLSQIPNVYLAIAGSSSLWGSSIVNSAPGSHAATTTQYDRAVREELASALRQRRSRFVGKAPFFAIPALYAASDAVVVPSVWREGFGLVALEAMASARPVIASRVGGLPEIVSVKSGILVEPGGTTELAAAMASLATSRDLRRRMGAAAREEARGYSWAEAAKCLEGVYRSHGGPAVGVV